MAGRKSKYESHVKPHIKEIEEWVKSGATEKEICTALGVAESTFALYKNEYSELSRALSTGRQNVVLNIKAALYKKAVGMEYEERRGVQKNGEFTSVEVVKKYIPPDTTAAAMLLRNYDENWRDKDSATNDLKQQEIEVRKAIAKATNFDVEF